MTSDDEWDFASPGGASRNTRARTAATTDSAHSIADGPNSISNATTSATATTPAARHHVVKATHAERISKRERLEKEWTELKSKLATVESEREAQVAQTRHALEQQETTLARVRASFDQSHASPDMLNQAEAEYAKAREDAQRKYDQQQVDLDQRVAMERASITQRQREIEDEKQHLDSSSSLHADTDAEILHTSDAASSSPTHADRDSPTSEGDEENGWHVVNHPSAASRSRSTAAIAQPSPVTAPSVSPSANTSGPAFPSFAALHQQNTPTHVSPLAAATTATTSSDNSSSATTTTTTTNTSDSTMEIGEWDESVLSSSVRRGRSDAESISGRGRSKASEAISTGKSGRYVTDTMDVRRARGKTRATLRFQSTLRFNQSLPTQGQPNNPPLSPSMRNDPSMTCSPVYKRIADLPDGIQVKNFAISVKCRQLIKMDWLSLSDPIVVLSQYNPQTALFECIGNTEWQFDTHNPDYMKKILLPANPAMGSQLEFSVFDVDTNTGLVDNEVFEEKDRMGSAVVSLDALKARIGEPLEFSLRNGERKKFDAQLVQNKAVLVVTLEIGQIQPIPHADKKSSARKTTSPTGSNTNTNKSISSKHSTPSPSTSTTPSPSDTHGDVLDADFMSGSRRSRPRSEAIGLSKTHKHTPSTSMSSLSSSSQNKLSPIEMSSASSSPSRYEGQGSEVPPSSDEGWVRKLTNFFTGRQKSPTQAQLQAQANALTEALIAQDNGRLDWEDPAVDYSALDGPAEHSQLFLYVHAKEQDEPKSGCCGCCPWGR